MKSSAELLAEKIAITAAFCLEHRGRCFAGWSESKVFKFLAFHALSKTLLIVRNGARVTGAAVAWPLAETELHRRELSGRPQFEWAGLPEPGKALLVFTVVGDRGACALLWRQALVRWPEVNRVFAYRSSGSRGARDEGRGTQLRRLDKRTIARFLTLNHQPNS